jgi:drug/metabolite transporter (DMT)-like permease
MRDGKSMLPAAAPAPASVQTHSHDRGASDWLILLGPGVIWGASFLFIAEGLRSIGPNGLTFTRILLGFTALAFVPGARKPVARGDLWKVALLGVIWMAFPLSMFPYAEQRVSSAVTGMLNGANPLFTAIVASFLFRKGPSRGIVTGLIVGLVGVVLIALPTISEGRSSLDGIIMIFLALVSYAFALNLARPLQQQYGALPVIWRAQGAALLLTAPLGFGELLQAHWSPAPLLSILALGALGTGVAFVLMAVAAGRLGATRASAMAFLIPPVALALGVFIRGESVAWASVLGGAICVAGAWIMRRSQISM